MIRVLHVTAALWEFIGGPSESVPNLCAHLAKNADLKITLVTLSGKLPHSIERARMLGVEVIELQPLSTRNIWFTHSYTKNLPFLVQNSEIVHVHGLWLHPMWVACALALKYKKKLVITPRGSLDPIRLKKSSWKKKLVAPLFDNRFLRGADCIHATATSEYLNIRAYKLNNPIAIVPNGLAIPNLQEIDSLNYINQKFPHLTHKRICLFISRINPTKGVRSLIEAWASVHKDFQDWHLIIAGPDERGHSKYLKKLIKKLKLEQDITFMDAVYGEDKLSLLSSASLFVLPTLDENFGIVIAEALFCKIPVITTQGAPWPEIEKYQCGWWIPIGTHYLIRTFRVALSLPESTLKGMGINGRRWVENNFSWDEVATQMYQVYLGLQQNTLSELPFVTTT